VTVEDDRLAAAAAFQREGLIEKNSRVLWKMVRLRGLVLENSEGFCMIDVASITL